MALRLTLIWPFGASKREFLKPIDIRKSLTKLKHDGFERVVLWYLQFLTERVTAETSTWMLDLG